MTQIFRLTSRATAGAAAIALLSLAAHAQTAATAPTTAAGAGITLHSVSVDLPTGDRIFAGGPEADAINNNCLACHSAGMILNQPAMPAAVWQEEVAKMRAAFKAPIQDTDVPAILAWLTREKGVK